MDAEHKAAECKRKWSKKSVKKSHLASPISSPSQLSAESGDSDGDTEALLSTSSQSRWGAPNSS